MSSISLCDLFVDKLLTFSSKMKENPFYQSSSLCLMSDNSLLYHNPGTMDNLINSNDFAFDSYNFLQKNTLEYPLIKNIGGCDFRHNQFNFSPHLFGVVHDSIRYLANQSDMLFSSQHKLNIASVLSDLFNNQTPSKQEKEIKSGPIVKKPICPVNEPSIQMSLTVKSTSSGKINSEMANCKLNMPYDVTMNLELANRKAKELQKRSKKRRRRQKRTKQNGCSNRSSKTQESFYDCLSTSPIFSHGSYTGSSSTDSHFLISVNQQGKNKSKSAMSSFVISVESVSDDDSEWDSCSESDISNDAADFEFEGLVVTNLCVPDSYYPSHSFRVECSVTTFESAEEANEMAKIKAMLLKVNKKWNEATKGIKKEAKLPSKVSFASEDKLVEVLPVDICDRKGEWEMYATERLRFQRRINELHDVISPCLSPKHRLNIYTKLFQSSL